MMTECERQKILIEWNNTTTELPQDRSILQLFEQQVVQRPDATALIFNDTQLTYAELNRRANQLAYYLQHLGVGGALGAETLVGVCMARSLDLVVGLLGTLKAGGVYLPLDPTYPSARLLFMLQDAAPRVVITQRQYHGLLASTVPLVSLDADAPLLALQPVDNPTLPRLATQLAYTIYTSGSTGQPKGVLLEHGGLYNLAQAQIKIFAIRHDSRILQLVSPNFDVSISDIAMTLCAGATLVLAPPDQLQIGAQLTHLLRQQAITHLEVTPAVLATVNPEEVPALQTIIVGGEVSTPKLVAQWTQGRRLFNAYGPTETTVCATIMDCTTWSDRQQAPPIGRPLANTQIYLLDQAGQPVPVGEAGELYIGGIGVARGYLNRPELTAERFIGNPFGVGRLYRTGDLARWRPDGTIEYLGRTDQQVKLRGFRIELGEIEAVLRQHPAVQDAVVIVREDERANQQLIAYVVATQTDATTPPEHTVDALPHLREHLQSKLPAYMVPAAFTLLAAFPLTPNGKIDRKALPAPSTRPTLPAPLPSVPAAAASKGEAQTPTVAFEQAIGKIWCDLLALEAIGRHDNFFDLGGHSLLLAEVQKKVMAQLGVEIQLVELLHYPTIHALADFLRRRQQGSTLAQAAASPSPSAVNPAALRQEQRRRRLQTPSR